MRERYGVDITPLSYIPGGRIDSYLGNLNFFFIRESTSIRENGGISGFVHNFITEVRNYSQAICYLFSFLFFWFCSNSKKKYLSFQLLAVIRAHVTALGGNAMVSFYMSELTLVDNPHKNQVGFLCSRTTCSQFDC